MGKEEYDKVKKQLLSEDTEAWKRFAESKQISESLGVAEHKLFDVYRQQIIDGQSPERMRRAFRKVFEERFSKQQIWKLSQDPELREFFRVLDLFPIE